MFLCQSFWTCLCNSVSHCTHFYNAEIWQFSSKGLPRRASPEGLFTENQEAQSFNPQSLLPIPLGVFPMSQAVDLSCTINDIKILKPRESRINPAQLPYMWLVRSVLRKETAGELSPTLSLLTVRSWDQQYQHHQGPKTEPGPHPGQSNLNLPCHKALSESYVCSSLQNAVLSTAIRHGNSASHLHTLDEMPEFWLTLLAPLVLVTTIISTLRIGKSKAQFSAMKPVSSIYTLASFLKTFSSRGLQ